MSAGGAAARGPLGLLMHSSSAQWASLGAGTLYFFPEKFNDVLLPSLQSLLDVDLSSLRLAAPSATTDERSIPSSIVIHASGGGGDSTRKTIALTLFNWTLGATAVWVVFSLGSGYLPENMKTMLPVSRNVFDRVSQKLADSLTNVKDILGKQLLKLRQQQDHLQEKQDETHKDVRNIQGEMGKARQELLSLLQGMDSCHDRLDESHEIQSYTARGVKLLARCVATILPNNDRIMPELERFQRGDSHLQIKRLNDDDDDGTSNDTDKAAPETPMPALPPSSLRTPSLVRDEDDDDEAVKRLLNSGRISVQ